MTNNLAFQLNSLKNECEQDFEGTLSRLNEMGFTAVEFGSFYGKSPEEILSLLNKYNLQLAGTHVPMDEMLDNFDEIVSFQKKINGTKIIIMFGDIHGSESLSLLIDNLNAIHCRLRQHRIDLYYHNNEQEFKKYSKGDIALAEIMDRTDILLELDTFWAEQAGADISELFETYSDRIKLVHLKDGENHAPLPIGLGTANCKLAFDLAIKNEVEWIIVELGGSFKNAFENYQKSIDYIKNNF